MTHYEEFLRSKMVATPERGIAVDASDINPLLKPHQAAIVRWALRKGNAAIFAAFGLGKTFMQLEIARLISRHTCEPFLITAPLGVRQEFRHDANMLGVDLTFIRETREAKLGAPHIYVTNYESVREGKINPRKFAGASLDEAAILRPMQFDLADRAIAQFSMKSETVFDPFAGLGTVPLRALKLGRKGIGCELSAPYFKDACFYLEAAERQLATPSLFDLIEAAVEVPA